ncbi:MAG TPA: hypothetical protein VFG45_07600 [Candidatus Nitrosocosmicus sp.]|nr:hypothetical protein [Candidatus Nitrosocosmicus sp.]
MDIHIKLHKVSNASSPVIVPIAADVTTVNIPNNHVYLVLVYGLYPETMKRIHFIAADHGI